MTPCNLFPLLAKDKKKQFQACPTYGGSVQSNTHVCYQCFPRFSHRILLSGSGSWECGGWGALGSAGGGLQMQDSHVQSRPQQRPQSRWCKVQPESRRVPGPGSIVVWAWGWKDRRSSSDSQARGVPSYSALCLLFQSATDGAWPTCRREGNLLY